MLGDTIMIEMDSAQILYYLEGCARGSHLRQGCWHDMIRLYPKMSQCMRDFLYKYAKRDITQIYEPYNGYRVCGAEDFDQFLACFDKENRYMVTATDGNETETAETYLYQGKYYLNENRYFASEYITNIEKITT